MKARFSERLGLIEGSLAIQINGMDEALRNGLWNLFYIHIVEDYSFEGLSESFARVLWKDFYKEPVNEIPDYASSVMEEIRERFFGSPWYHPYEFFEFLLSLKLPGRTAILKNLNSLLERERSGYRLMDDLFAPITEAEEVMSVETAATAGPFAGVRTHIKRALQCYADRAEPDYRNCVKEAISAVEAVARELTGKKDLTPALAVLTDKHQLPSALKEGFIKLYSYTSGEHGIRHALLTTGEPVQEAEARYMLVTCSAFVNYLVSRYATTGEISQAVD